MVQRCHGFKGSIKGKLILTYVEWKDLRITVIKLEEDITEENEHVEESKERRQKKVGKVQIEENGEKLQGTEKNVGKKKTGVGSSSKMK